MLTIDQLKGVYPDLGDEPFYGPGSYDNMIYAWGYNVLVNVSDQDYQGDTYVIIRDPLTDKYGYLNFGWGSCSGCDALQGCDTWQEIKDLNDSLHSSIRWHNTAAEILHFLESHDWEGEYVWHEEDFKVFLEEAITVMRDLVGP